MSVPADSKAITSDWLTAALREAGAISHARVNSIQSGPVGHMGMTGQLYRPQIGYAGRAFVPAGEVLCPPPRSPGNRPLDGILRTRDRLLS
jgi:hypothetical protein